MKTLSGGGLNMPRLQISELDGVPLVAQQLQKYEMPSCSQIYSQRSTKLVSNDVDYASSRLEDENQHHICLGSRRQDCAKGSILFSRGSARIMKCKCIEWLLNIFIRIRMTMPSKAEFLVIRELQVCELITKCSGGEDVEGEQWQHYKFWIIANNSASVFFKSDRGSFLKWLPVGRVCSLENVRQFLPMDKKSTLQTDLVLKVLGLDICADTMVGGEMRRGISGGQKRRMTTAAGAYHRCYHIDFTSSTSSRNLLNSLMTSF
ncbi:hypothetical protein Pint_21797 [Pistacia integerrima]|uniref:Uncharacterized protein n=1 Tax=Pistacia integerrima TaxID=434235 RepID=A0ACC0X8H3_9ROSI|nr:hypothetical protein Pint_21797 [Pistacia integerrima]